MCFFFFFSSRRRHTRWTGDWSSDVCSSDLARWIKEKSTKPVVGFIAGQTAPPGRRMGHAGAIIGGADDTAAAKMKILGECGVHVVASPADIGKTMAEVLKKQFFSHGLNHFTISIYTKEILVPVSAAL